MDFIREADFRKLLPNVAGRAFLFFGEEDYLKGNAVRQARAALCPDPSMSFFNDITIDALDFTPEKLLDAMAAPPMMEEAKLIVLRGFDFTAVKQTELDALIGMLGELESYPYNCIILHVAAELLDMGYFPKSPGTVLKKMAEVVTPVLFETPTEAQLCRWVEKHFGSHGVTAAPQLCRQLVAYAGNNMYILSNEIEKLAFYVKAHNRNALTPEDIHTVAVPETPEEAFALSNAILTGDGEKALTALSLMKFQRIEPSIVMGEITRTLGDMQSFYILANGGKSVQEIAAQFKISPYKVGIYVRALQGVPKERLAHVIAMAVEADKALKFNRAYMDYSPIEKLITAL